MISQKSSVLFVTILFIGSTLLSSSNDPKERSCVAPAVVDNPRPDEGAPSFEELYRQRGEELARLQKECDSLRQFANSSEKPLKEDSLKDVSRNFVPIGSTWKRWLPMYPESDLRSNLPNWMCERPFQGYAKWSDVLGLFVFTTAVSLWHENLRGMNSAKSGKQLVAILRNMIPWGEVKFSMQRRAINFGVGSGMYCLSRFAYFKSQDVKDLLKQGFSKDKALADKDEVIKQLRQQMEDREKSKTTPFE